MDVVSCFVSTAQQQYSYLYISYLVYFVLCFAPSTLTLLYDNIHTAVTKSLLLYPIFAPLSRGLTLCLAQEPYRLIYFVVTDQMRTTIAVLRAILKEG